MKNEHRDGCEFDFLIGKSIKEVKEGSKKKYWEVVDLYTLVCNDGTEIEIETNAGCGGCGNGWSSFDDLKKLEKNHNVITNVKCEYEKNSWGEQNGFKLFIFYQDDMLTLEGDDGYGNGYYGGGFYVTIKDVEKVEED
jgi:hypothetical protein